MLLIILIIFDKHLFKYRFRRLDITSGVSRIYFSRGRVEKKFGGQKKKSGGAELREKKLYKYRFRRLDISITVAPFLHEKKI